MQSLQEVRMVKRMIERKPVEIKILFDIFFRFKDA